MTHSGHGHTAEQPFLFECCLALDYAATAQYFHVHWTNVFGHLSFITGEFLVGVARKTIWVSVSAIEKSFIFDKARRCSNLKMTCLFQNVRDL